MIKINRTCKQIRQLQRHFSNISDFNELTLNCSAPAWSHYQKHKLIFNMIRQTIRPYAGYYKLYKETLGKFYGAVRSFEAGGSTQEIDKLYGDVWDFICEFFSSKEYLGNYNPIFFNSKGKKEKEDVLGKVFELDESEIERDLYEGILHLLYKEIVDDRYYNLRKLQWGLIIIKKWREAVQSGIK